MAVKKTEKKKDDAAKPAKAAKAAAKEAPAEATPKAPKAKKVAPKAKKEAAPAAPAPVAKAEPKPEPKAEPKAPKKAAAAPVKLTSSQTEILKKINDAAEGYVVEKKIEQRTIDALLEKKLIKKGAKKDGKPSFLISNVGKKHIAS